MGRKGGAFYLVTAMSSPRVERAKEREKRKRISQSIYISSISTRPDETFCWPQTRIIWYGLFSLPLKYIYRIYSIFSPAPFLHRAQARSSCRSHNRGDKKKRASWWFGGKMNVLRSSRIRPRGRVKLKKFTAMQCNRCESLFFFCSSRAMGLFSWIYVYRWCESRSLWRGRNDDDVTLINYP